MISASITPTAYKDNSGISVMTDGGVEISLFGATGSLTKQRNEFYDWQCLFGTVRVAAREKPYGDLSCLSTSLAGGSTRRPTRRTKRRRLVTAR